MIEIIFLAVALSMDVFAVSISMGANKPRPLFRISMLAAIYFGLLHAAFPYIGYVGGVTVFAWLDAISRYVAFIILVALGCKAIYDSFQVNPSQVTSALSHKTILLLAVATSIDALATGFTLALLTTNPILSCAIIGLTTYAFSLLGIFIGTKGSKWFNFNTELIGGLILILIGFKILLF